jgi:serine/threonine protein kinase
MSLMEGLLRMDPKERLTAKEALCHPYFDGLRN